MNLQIGSQVFENVTIPLLWGKRAIVQDEAGHLSIIDLGGPTAKVEVIGDEPAPGVEFVPTVEGFEIMRDNKALYSYSPGTRTIASGSLALPPLQICETETRIGINVFSGNVVVGSGVGIIVSESGVGMGGPLPPGLAKLVV